MTARLRRLWLAVPITVALFVPLLTGVTPGAAPAQAEAAPAAPSRAVAAPAPGQGQPPDQGEGFQLAAVEPSVPTTGARCTLGAPARTYDVAAVAVDITLNRYLDHDPLGRMYALEEDLPRVRDEEARNAAARAGTGEPAVSVGLQGDAIQPLALRVTPGECLRVRFRNALPEGEAASINLHGAGLVLAGSPPRPAIASEPGAVIGPGATATYEWMVGDAEPEGTHYFHSHGPAERVQANHGLFGAVIVEPKGSTWADPRTAAPLRTGWDAVVTPPIGPAFREFAIFYHEVGDETYQVLDRNDAFVPLVDPLTSAYRPGGRAINYRSEPFLNRLALQKAVTGSIDESLAYSSYAFGDPATPVLRSYVGDPVKQRLVHAGSEVFHVHHVHGGGIRWPRQPGVQPARLDAGLDKRPPLRPDASERTDSQSVGPSETYDILSECGSGGCQQSAGDFMVHCHVFNHYFAGMWGLWRVYNTLQDGPASTDALAPLPELPTRGGRVAAAVGSAALLGSTVDWAGGRVAVGPAELTDIVTRQLPPPGVPRGYDATVLDWTRKGEDFLGEPETAADWPGYRARAPATRPALLFDPRTGKLAYPFLRPHLARRPPFAPEHGPAPFLDPVHPGTGLPAPGANGPASICPAGAGTRRLDLNAVPVPVPLNAGANLVDPGGQLFVLRQQEDAVLADPAARVPLVVRANAGDCLDVLLRSELTDGPETPLSKVSAHVHFMQFDVQGSDGVSTGFNYEQTVRPFRAAGETIVAATAPGATGVRLADASGFQPGAMVGVGMDRDRELEFRRVAAVAGDVVTFDAPLAQPHAAGEVVSGEFVRYRWYADAQFGTAFFHDHTNVLASGRHGLFGAVIVEPPGSTYHDPVTGAELISGPVADIHTGEPVSADIDGSFREFAVLMQDDNPLTAVGRSAGSSVNLRSETPEGRGRDPSMAFSSAGNGDPATPVFEALLGDPLVIRTLVGAANDVHTWHLDGHWFRREPWSRSSPPVDTATIGISERFDLSVPAAGGPQRLPGDYLWYGGRTFKLREGGWGILRVHEGAYTGLQRLPGYESPPPPAGAVCPAGAPRKAYDVVAVDAVLPMLGGDTGKVFVLAADRDAVLAGQRSPQPLVLHVGVGDCVEVRLSNATTGGPVSLHPDMLAFDPRTSGGVAAGNDPPQAVAPGETRTLTWYASPEVGMTVGLLRDWGNVLVDPGAGGYGAVVVGPSGATYHDPATGADASNGSAWTVDVHPPTGGSYRDVSLFFQDSDAGIGTHKMPYPRAVSGVVGLNYQAAPVDDQVPGTPPATPLIEAAVGDRLRINVLAPSSEQVQVFGIEGHRWSREPGRAGSDLVSAEAVGGTEARSLWLVAGGPAGLPGDYRYGAERGPYREAGLWGVLRVRPGCAPGVRCDGAGAAPALVAVAVVGAVAVAVLVTGVRRRRRGTR